MAKTAPRIVEIDRLESISAFNPTTLSSSTKCGGSDNKAGLNKLEAAPTKKEDINKSAKKVFPI